MRRLSEPPLAILLTLMLAAIARADGFIVVHDSPARPDHFGFAPLEVTYHRVTVEIDGNVATTSVDQEFYNPNARQLEGTYLFPLPAGATIDKFSMDVNGQMTDAELLDADRARQVYEEIVRRYRDPALLEYAGSGAFKVRIFPIEANGRKHVKITYTQVLKPDAGLVEYVYPLNTEKFSARPLKDVSVKVALRSERSIKSIYSPSHDVDVTRAAGDRSATVGFEARDVRPDTDFKLIWSTQASPVAINLLAYRNASDEGHFLLLASPGTDVATAQVQPKDVCFVVDTSGSMAGPKMEQARKALLFCLANLNAGDRFEIIRFSTEAEAFNGKLVDASEENVKKAYAFVKELKPRGGTAIADAMQRAIELFTDESSRPHVVIFLTDGQPTIGETNPDKIVNISTPGRSGVRGATPRLAAPRIFSFGIGTDINTHLLDRIANATRGMSQYVLPDEDIEVKVTSFYEKIRSPVLGDVEIDVPDPRVRLSEVYPNVLPDLFKGETLMAFGRYHGFGKTQVRVRGVMNGETKEFVADVEFAEHQTKHAYVPRLWATRRVGWLLEEIRLNGESRELKDEVVRLAREHGIVTPYTAYLILEDERVRNVPVALRTMREMEADRAVAADVARQYQAREQAAGPQAVNDSVTLQRMKTGYNEAQVQTGAAGMNKSLPATVPTGAAGYKVAQNYGQQVRVLNGRAFYQNGSTWTDAQVQTKQDLKRREIAFNGDDYFALLRTHPDAAPWLSLGNEVDVVIGDTLYVIR